MIDSLVWFQPFNRLLGDVGIGPKNIGIPLLIYVSTSNTLATPNRPAQIKSSHVANQWILSLGDINLDPAFLFELPVSIFDEQKPIFLGHNKFIIQLR